MDELNETDLGQRNELVRNLTDESAAISAAVVEANEKIAALNEKIARYNNTLKNAADFRDTIVKRMQDHQNEQSEKWNDSEEGSFYQDWIDGWEALDFESVDQEDVIQLNEHEHAVLLDEAAEMPEEAE